MDNEEFAMQEDPHYFLNKLRARVANLEAKEHDHFKRVTDRLNVHGQRIDIQLERLDKAAVFGKNLERSLSSADRDLQALKSKPQSSMDSAARADISELWHRVNTILSDIKALKEAKPAFDPALAAYMLAKQGLQPGQAVPVPSKPVSIPRWVKVGFALSAGIAGYSWLSSLIGNVF